MDDHYWKAMLLKLDDSELRRLRQKIDSLLTQNGQGRDSEDHIPSELDRATFYSNTSTLYHSGRSTPKASSISNDKRPSFSSGTGGVPNQSPPSTETCLWPTYPATNQHNHLQPSLRLETLRKTYDVSGSSETATRQLFCTFCAEEGKHKVIKAKQDWKRHQEDFHVGTGLQWICQVKGCSHHFLRGGLFKNHLKKDHNGEVYPRDCKEVRQSHRVYACGFENCRELNYTWKDHCDHVSTHMLKGHTAWSYDKVIRNLLKHPDISGQWKLTYNNMCPPLQIIPTELTWNPKTTERMREQLEFHSFQGRLDEFLQRLFLMGVPKAKAEGFTIHPTQLPNFASSQAQTTPPMSFQPLPSLPSSVVPFNLAPPLGDSALSSGNVDAAGTETVAQHRNSILMTDAPPLDASATFEFYQIEPVGEVPLVEEELLSLEDFISDTTTYYGANVPDNNKSYPRRSLMTKSKEWLTAKKSQHFQPLVIEHPDVPPNMRLPASSPRRKQSAAGHTSASNRLYSNQS